MKSKAYLETTIASYLTARPSRDLITAANQQMTHDWWHDHRGNFDLYISHFVIEEASAGDPGAATRRLAVLVDLPQLNRSTQDSYTRCHGHTDITRLRVLPVCQ